MVEESTKLDVAMAKLKADMTKEERYMDDVENKVATETASLHEEIIRLGTVPFL